MTDFDSPSTRQQFEAMTVDLGLEDFVPELQDMHIAAMDGERVALDAFSGEDLREVLLGAQTEARAMLRKTKISHDSRKAVARIITHSVSKALIGHRQAEVVGELVAIRGINTFLYQNGQNGPRYSGDLLNDS